LLNGDRWGESVVRVPLWRGAQGGRNKRSIHVLMIEDDPAIAEMFQMQLEHDGYRVTVAGTAEVGLAAIASAPPDIILLDLLLPAQSGFELMTTLEHELPSHPPIVILSNFGEPGMISQGLSLGAVDYLVKARVTPSLVSRSIPGWLEKPRKGPRN
jgi:DNA-binding response OmpR family regulator